MGRVAINLTTTQRNALIRLRDTHTNATVRERAAAILQVANGKTIKEVAHAGLVKRRKEETVSGWIKRYLEEGPDGLTVRPGRGRKPRQ